VWLPPRVNGPGVDHSSAGGPEDGSACGPLWSRTASVWSASAINHETLLALSAHQESSTHTKCIRAPDVLHDAAAGSRMPRTSRAAASVLMTGPSVARIDAADDVVEPPSSASRVVCRCLEWPKLGGPSNVVASSTNTLKPAT
jgi:hypothetical protein